MLNKIALFKSVAISSIGVCLISRSLSLVKEYYFDSSGYGLSIKSKTNLVLSDPSIGMIGAIFMLTGLILGYMALKHKEEARSC